MSSWMYDTFKQKGKKSMARSGNGIYHWPDAAHLLFGSLTYTDLDVTKVADTASNEGEVTEKTCEIADVPTSFK